MTVLLGEYLGGLIATFVLSRVLLWLTRQWDGGVTRYVLIHGLSLALAALLGGMGMADGGPFAPAHAAQVYAPCQALWLIVDLARVLVSPKTSPVGSVTARWLAVAAIFAAFSIIGVSVFGRVADRFDARSEPEATDGAWPGAEVVTLLCEGTEHLEGGLVEREGTTRTVLRVHASATAILDHSGPAVMSIFACDQNCTLTVNDVAIVGITRAPDTLWQFHISRITGDYSGAIEFQDMGSRSVEIGRCRPTDLSRQF